jgi:hypothetical protein
MIQEIQSQPPNSKKKLIITVIISVLSTTLIVGFSVYYLTLNSIDKKIQTQKNNIESTLQQNTSSTKENKNIDDTTTNIVQDEKIYFAKGSQGNYALIDLKNGETQKFIPEGYEIVSQHQYDPLPQFLILEKNNNLFSYEIENKLMNKIFIFDNLLLKEDEKARLHPSITEKNKFFIVINEFDPNEESEIGLYNPINTRSYFFDASINKLVSTNDINFDGCVEYDSKNQRFFSWPCAEGIGSSIPLSILNINGKKQKEVISLSEFGLAKDNLGPVTVQYNNGLFFALSKGAVDKIIMIDPKPQEPQKEIHEVTETVKNQIKDKSYPYSTAFVKSQNTFIIGGGSFITLLRSNDNQITESKTFPEQGLYANFIFPYENTLYYQSRNAKAIRLIDLNTWKITKTIPIETSEEITLIKID